MTVTLITGASRGIGKFLADHYREMGHEVLAWSRSGGQDVTDEDAVRDALRYVPRIDNLINCAGIAAMNHTLLTPTAKAREVLDTNVTGSFIVTREVARLMMRQKHGRIVNFSTVAVPLRLEGESIYAASKAAVETMTRVHAREFALFGITVNAIGPNPIGTDLLRGIPTAKLDTLLKSQAIPRMGEMADVANVVDFFLRPESSMVTGQVIYLGGV